MEHDPMRIARRFLIDNDVAAADIDALEAAARDEMTAVYDSASETDWPAAELAARDVQDLGGPA
jgi:TPP-dependent pyruvate/acetoin dehydrogenase alpha subunit